MKLYFMLWWENVTIRINLVPYNGYYRSALKPGSNHKVV